MKRIALLVLLVATSADAIGNGDFRKLRKNVKRGSPLMNGYCGTGDCPLFSLLKAGSPEASTECAGTNITAFSGQAVTVNRSTASSCVKADGTVVKNLPANTPVIYAISGQGSLYIDGAHTNLALNSEAPNLWTLSGFVDAAPTVVQNTIVAPDGTTTADPVTWPGSPTTTSAGSVIQQGITADLSAMSESIWMKNRFGGATNNLVSTTNSGAIKTTSAKTITSNWARFSNINMTGLNSSVAFQVGAFGSALVPTGTAAILAQVDDVWGFQVEKSQLATMYIPTAGTAVQRTGDVVTISNPLSSSDTTWCISAYQTTLYPLWTSVAAAKGILHFGSTLAAANTADFAVDATGHPYITVYDSTAALKKFTVTAALSAGGHTLQACNAAGTLTIAVDGSDAAGATTPGGTGQITTQPATVYIGQQPALVLSNAMSQIVIDNQSPPRAP